VYSRERHDFIDLYLSELLIDTASVFYQEIADNQNLLSSHRYNIPESNRVIHFLLSDPKFAHENNIYKPIGDYALNHLDDLARDHLNDPYNQAMGDFQESGAWSSPLYVVVRFFDIMVEEALHQGIEWHMWLYYMPLMVKKIVRNYRLVDPLARPDAEFPIKYSFLLYQIFSALCDWVEELENVDLGQKNVVLKSTRADHENGNIPKSSILALSECSRLVLTSDNLTDRIKNYLLDMVFQVYFDLRLQGKFCDYAKVLGNALAQGGTFKSHHDEKYHLALMNAFEEEKTEYLIKYSEELVMELEATLKGESPDD